MSPSVLATAHTKPVYAASNPRTALRARVTPFSLSRESISHATSGFSSYGGRDSLLFGKMRYAYSLRDTTSMRSASVSPSARASTYLRTSDSAEPAPPASDSARCPLAAWNRAMSSGMGRKLSTTTDGLCGSETESTDAVEERAGDWQAANSIRTPRDPACLTAQYRNPNRTIFMVTHASGYA